MGPALTPSSPAELRQALTRLVLERGYERREQAFVLNAGGTSHDYVDMRRAVSRGEDLLTAGRALLAALQEEGIEFDAVGGMTMGADPVAHAVAMISGLSWYSVRKATKDHGTGRRIEGATVEPGVRVVVLEDTVSTGKSILEAYDVVRETGADVVAATTLLDRGDMLAARFEEMGVRYVPVITYREVGLDPIGGAPAGDSPRH